MSNQILDPCAKVHWNQDQNKDGYDGGQAMALVYVELRWQARQQSFEKRDSGVFEVLFYPVAFHLLSWNSSDIINLIPIKIAVCPLERTIKHAQMSFSERPEKF